LQCGTGLPACQRLTCVAPGSAIQVSPPNERRRPSAQVASQKPSCFVGQPILAAAGFQPALSILRFVGFCRKRRSHQGSSVARVNALPYSREMGHRLGADDCSRRYHRARRGKSHRANTIRPSQSESPGGGSDNREVSDPLARYMTDFSACSAVAFEFYTSNSPRCLQNSAPPLCNSKHRPFHLPTQASACSTSTPRFFGRPVPRVATPGEATPRDSTRRHLDGFHQWNA
jgi:hypothetical protein